jgi:hypothetical protein
MTLKSWRDTLIPILRKKDPQLAEATDNESLWQIYHNVLLRLVVDIMESIFVNNWDVTVTHFNLPSGQPMGVQHARNPPRPGIKVHRKDIAALFPQFYGIGDADVIPYITLPPATKVSGFSDSVQTVLKLRNSLATVEIAIRRRGLNAGVAPTILRLCRLPFEGEHNKFRTLYFVISLSADFKLLWGGHPDMPAYKRWVTTAFSELRRLSSEVRWAEVKQQYQLLYAHRTESPIQEMQRQILEKGRKQQGSGQ